MENPLIELENLFRPLNTFEHDLNMWKDKYLSTMSEKQCKEACHLLYDDRSCLRLSDNSDLSIINETIDGLSTNLHKRAEKIEKERVATLNRDQYDPDDPLVNPEPTIVHARKYQVNWSIGCLNYVCSVHNEKNSGYNENKSNKGKKMLFVLENGKESDVLQLQILHRRTLEQHRECARQTLYRIRKSITSHLM